MRCVQSANKSKLYFLLSFLIVERNINYCPHLPRLVKKKLKAKVESTWVFRYLYITHTYTYDERKSRYNSNVMTYDG